tara:strand:+ start:8981 stop:9331 length:351 start_codon:yes stop_codon:yes gene_type:complete
MEESWVDGIRNWNYSPEPVLKWLWNIVEYNAVRHGPIAYVVAASVVILLLLAFGPTRGATKALCSSILKMVVLYFQLVLSLVTVQFVAFLAKVALTLFHKCRIWIADGLKRFRKQE